MKARHMKVSVFFTFLFIMLLITTTTSVYAMQKGIYLTQYTLENTALIQSIIKRAKKSGINSFIVDLNKPTNQYKKNISLVKENNLRWIVRIVMFPDGGTADQIKNTAYWQKKYSLIETAIAWGADEVQLDYIRYKASQFASKENAININNIIKWYHEQLSKINIPLQIDVFGIASYGESKHIGQNIKLFGNNVDVICPMVYPSHFEPFAKHYKTPYQTVFDALQRINNMFANKRPFRLIPWIELSNYHYPMSRNMRIPYIKAQIKAAIDANADGWYAWSPHNRYDYLFDILEKER